MGKLICDDGEEVEISKEAEANLREKFGKKKRFKTIELCHLRIEINKNQCYVILSWRGSENICVESPEGIRHIIKSLQSAVDFIENR